MGLHNIKPHVTAQPGANSDRDQRNIDYTLPAAQFAEAIRAIRRGRQESATQILAVSDAELQRLGVAPDATAIAGETPDGSDHVELISLYEWMRKLQATYKRAVRQLVQINATARGRR